MADNRKLRITQESRDLIDDLYTAIRERRAEMGVSQLLLSEMTGLQRHYISEIENGKRDPNIFTIVRLMKALNMDIRFEAMEK